MEPKITPLSEALNSFPHFMPNQVLTNKNLNELAVYLEQQDRFTRQRLIGIGIVCGLQANLKIAGSSATVEISKGVGVTSCGFLIDVPQKLTFTKKINYVTPQDYAPFLSGTTPITCMELKPGDSTLEGIEDLTTAHTTNKIVVLFLDLEDKPNGKCIGENCDEKGNKWLFTLRVLLIPKSKMNEVLTKTYTPNPFNNPLDTDPSRQDFFNPEYALPTVFIERFGNKNSDPDEDFILSSIESYSEFEDTYRSIIIKGSVRVANAIHRTYELFKPIFDTQLKTTVNPFSGFQNAQASNALTTQLKTFITPGDSKYQKGSCQYVYDFIRDLIVTYHELRDELFTLASECSPDPSRFPRHLMIGELKATDFGKFDQQDFAPPSVYRQYFSSSRILNEQSKHLIKAKSLIERLNLQIKNLSFSNILEPNDENEVVITPDKTCCAPLGDQRIPFYYTPEGTHSLIPYWNFQFAIQNRIWENRSYYMEQLVSPNTAADLKAKLQYPILFDTCGFPKLSIEGHVGKDLESAIEELKKIRKRYNLSFDILALKLDQSFNHVAIAEDNLFADLQDQYSLERNELVCCVNDLSDYIKKNQVSIVILLVMILFVLADNAGNLPPENVIAQILDSILDAYTESLDILAASLPPDIKDFNFMQFHQVFPAFNSFTTIFKYLVNTWGDIEFFLFDKEKMVPDLQRWTISDLITIFLNIWELYLDKIDDDCILGKFYTIYAAFSDRVEKFSLFNKFNESIHGMEHIAGTSKGGTFILVYEDQETQQEVTGKATDEKGNALKDVYIVDANNGNIFYGKTDSSGKYKVKVPEKGSTMMFMKAGYVATEVKATAKKKAAAKNAKSAKVEVSSYNDVVAGTKGPSPKLQGIDKVYVNLKYSYDELSTLDKNFALATKYVDLDIGFKPAAMPFVIEQKKSFQVVADFYLPHLIHNYKTELEPVDACKRLDEVKLVDIKKISKDLAKAMKTKLTVAKIVKNVREK